MDSNTFYLIANILFLIIQVIFIGMMFYKPALNYILGNIVHWNIKSDRLKILTSLSIFFFSFLFFIKFYRQIEPDLVFGLIQAPLFFTLMISMLTFILLGFYYSTEELSSREEHLPEFSKLFVNERVFIETVKKLENNDLINSTGKWNLNKINIKRFIMFLLCRLEYQGLLKGELDSKFIHSEAVIFFQTSFDYSDYTQIHRDIKLNVLSEKDKKKYKKFDFIDDIRV